MLSSLPDDTVPEARLIGRERELELAEKAFADAKGNRVPAIVRILGESGMGKTFFLSHLGRNLESRQWFVLQTACHTIQQHTPRLACNRVVAAAIRRLGSNSSRYTGGLEESLAAFDASIARAIGCDPAKQPIDPDGYVATLLRLFEGIAVDYDIAILCDDAQWIDEESAKALLTLPQKISTGCISLGVAERVVDDQARPRKWFPSATVHLTELGAEESLKLVATQLPGVDPKTAELVIHHAGGRPLELLMLCESVRSGHTTDLERSLRSRVAQDLSTVDSGVREFVHICALLSDPIEQRILLQLYPDHARLERLIERAARYVTVGPAGLEFRHAVLAQSVASTIAVPIPLHKRIISALETLDSLELTDLERMAKHAAACGDRKLEGEAYIKLAARANVREAASVVIAASERVLSLGAEEGKTPEFLAKYVMALRTYDREPEAVEFLMRELPSLSHSASAGLAQLVSMLIIMLVELERVEQATAIYRKYLSSVAREELFVLSIAMKYGALMTANDELFAELEAQLKGLADTAPTRTLAFDAAIDAGHFSLDGDTDRARERVSSALTNADPEDGRHVYLLQFASMMLDFRHIGVRPLSARLPELNVAVRRVGDIVYGNTCEAWEAFFKGDWSGALRAVGDYFRDDMPVPRAAPLLAIAAAIAALTGSESAFSREIEAVCFAALERGYRQSGMQLLPWWLVRHSDAALDRFTLELASDIGIRPPPFSALGYFPAGFALWAAERSQTDALLAIASLEETRDRSNWSRAHWSLTRGLALRALKDASAKTRLGEAAESFRALSAPFFAAFAAHHAGIAAPEEKKLLADLSVTKSTTSAKRSATSLTPREWDVSRLVGGGSTNRQIAETLFLSERTVEVHVGNIFGKLGLSSRAQLVRWLFENEVASSIPR